jgi:hypothetical protein
MNRQMKVRLAHLKAEGRAPAVRTKQVRCCGRLHRITWTDSGAVVLHNHTKANLAAMDIASTLGGSCACHQFLQHVRKREWDATPLVAPAFRGAAHVARSKQMSRMRRNAYKSHVQTVEEALASKSFAESATHRSIRKHHWREFVLRQLHMALMRCKTFGKAYETAALHLSNSTHDEVKVFMHGAVPDMLRAEACEAGSDVPIIARGTAGKYLQHGWQQCGPHVEGTASLSTGVRILKGLPLHVTLKEQVVQAQGMQPVTCYFEAVAIKVKDVQVSPNEKRCRALVTYVRVVDLDGFKVARQCAAWVTAVHNGEMHGDSGQRAPVYYADWSKDMEV